MPSCCSAEPWTVEPVDRASQRGTVDPLFQRGEAEPELNRPIQRRDLQIRQRPKKPLEALVSEAPIVWKVIMRGGLGTHFPVVRVKEGYCKKQEASRAQNSLKFVRRGEWVSHMFENFEANNAIERSVRQIYVADVEVQVTIIFAEIHTWTITGRPVVLTFEPVLDRPQLFPEALLGTDVEHVRRPLKGLGEAFPENPQRSSSGDAHERRLASIA